MLSSLKLYCSGLTACEVFCFHIIKWIDVNIFHYRPLEIKFVLACLLSLIVSDGNVSEKNQANQEYSVQECATEYTTKIDANVCSKNPVLAETIMIT